MIMSRGLPLATLLLLGLVTLGQAQDAGISDQPTLFAETQFTQLQEKKPIGGGINVGPLQTVKDLSISECEKLGCTIVKDKTCPSFVNWVGAKLKRRCVCPGGGNLCIDRVD